jgi:putative heme degradation protein
LAVFLSPRNRPVPDFSQVFQAVEEPEAAMEEAEVAAEVEDWERLDSGHQLNGLLENP